MFQLISDVDFKYKKPKVLKLHVVLGASRKLGGVFIQKMIFTFYPVETSWEFIFCTKCSFIHLIENSDRELLKVMVSMVKGRAIVLISIVRATCLR